MALASAKVTGWIGLHTSSVAVAWHMAWRSSLVHVSLVTGVPAWALRHSFSFSGEQSHLAGSKCLGSGRYRPPCFPGVSMGLVSLPAFSKPPRKWPTLARVFPGCRDVAGGLDLEYPPFGEFSWRFGVASGPSLCQKAEGLPRCYAGCLLSSVASTDFLFFPQPWARWPSVRSGKPWRHSRYMG